MKHSIVANDCSFRNFFHLIDGLVHQNYPREDFELIYVEQRSKETSDAFNHEFGLKSLSDRYEEVKDEINIEVIYLDDEESPYHRGKCMNAGIEAADGEIISTMDGDMLLPSDFLQKLTAYHEEHPEAVVNLYRKNSQYPAGVTSYEDWTESSFSFEDCLDACPDKYAEIPEKTEKYKGPMESARREFWEEIGGYATHELWSTPVTMLDADVCRRLEIATGSDSVALPDSYCIHPWHPIGTNAIRGSGEEMIEAYFGLQEELISWATDHEEPDHERRQEFADELYRENEDLVDEMLNWEVMREPGSADLHIPDDSIYKERAICKAKQMRGRVRRTVNRLVG